MVLQRLEPTVARRQVVEQYSREDSHLVDTQPAGMLSAAGILVEQEDSLAADTLAVAHSPAVHNLAVDILVALDNPVAGRNPVVDSPAEAGMPVERILAAGSLVERNPGADSLAGRNPAADNPDILAPVDNHNLADTGIQLAGTDILAAPDMVAAEFQVVVDSLKQGCRSHDRVDWDWAAAQHWPALYPSSPVMDRLLAALRFPPPSKPAERNMMTPIVPPSQVSSNDYSY